MSSQKVKTNYSVARLLLSFRGIRMHIIKNYSKKYSYNAKKTWELIKKLTANNNKCLPIRKLVYNAAEFSDDDGKVYTFNEFFANIGQSLSDDLEIINCNPFDSVMRIPSSIFFAPHT